MQEDTFLQKNFEYYQEWQHWLGKADKLKRAALILYQADLPDLRLYAHRVSPRHATDPMAGTAGCRLRAGI
jgi:hypothetical protein